jgi:hypothetical protein
METPTPSSASKTKLPWKQKMKREIVQYLITVLYLAFFFGAFTWYRRFILAAYDINYLNYGIAFIEALIMAKVVWLGEVLHIVRDRPDEPLLYPTLKKACVFTIFVALFGMSEQLVRARIEGFTIPEAFNKLIDEDKYELIARCVIIFCAFIPFFAFRELARELGEGKMWRMFIGRRKHGDFEPPGAPA